MPNFSKICRKYWSLVLLWALLFAIACKTVHKHSNKAPPGVTTGPTTPLGDSNAYAQNCASCHGPLATSSKLGRTPEQIKKALTTVSAMSFLKISDDTVSQISTLLGGLKPDDSKGPELYVSYCQSCHLSLENSVKKGAKVFEIKAAMNSVALMKSIQLSDERIAKIAQSLATDEAKLNDPSFVYARHCQTCHLELANSQKQNATISQISRAISFVPEMQHVVLSSAQIEALAVLLKTKPSSEYSPLPVIGDRLYIANVMLSLFKEPGPDSGPVYDIVQKRILSKAIFFGGLCRPNIDSGCPTNNRETASSPDRTVSARPVVNVARRANIIAACEEILNIEAALDTLLKQAGLNVQSDISPDNAGKLAALVFPNVEITSKFANSAAVLGSAASSSSGGREGWRFLGKQFCSSGLLEVM